MPETPVWRLGGDSEETINKDEEEKEGRKIQFLDEREVRSPRLERDVDSSTTSFALRDGVGRTRSMG
jgi:hypothetical protein